MKNKATIGLNKIYRLINPKSKLNTRLKILLYKTIIRPTITYATPTWNQAARTHHKTLQIIQNRTLRLILNRKYHKIDKLHKEAKLEKLKDFTDRLIQNFTDKTKTSDNILIKTLGQYNPIKLGKHKKQYKKLIILPGKNPYVLKT